MSLHTPTTPQTVVPKKKGYGNVEQGVKQLYPEPGSKKPTDIDIVFVPGLGAHPENSWKSAKTGFNWASNKDGVARDFPTARVLLYMHESAWDGPLKVKQFISNLASTLLHGLKTKRETTEASGLRRPIVFIGHSMGGLIVAKAVCIAESRPDQFPRMFEDIAGCAFFGTPFKGAEAASVAAMISHLGQRFDQSVPSKLLDLMKPGDEGLKELTSEFIRMATKLSPKIELCGFYEEQPTNLSDLSGVPAFIRSLKIPLPKSLAEFVTRDSAILDGITEPMGLACNHRDLVKFESFKDERYSLVRSPLKKIIHGAHLVVKGRRQATRGIDRTVVLDVVDALDGAPISRKRKKLAATTALSSWIPKEPEYINWLAQVDESQEPFPAKEKDCLWIRGSDGRGKTSAALAALEDIDQMIDPSADPPSVLLAYFLCDTSPDYGTAEELLKSLIRQLIAKQEHLASYAKFLLKRKGSKGLPQLTVENLWQALQDMLADSDLAGCRIYFVINNLQSLPQDSNSTGTLLDLLGFELENKDQPGRSAHVRWLITSGESFTSSQTLKDTPVRLIDLEDGKYADQVQMELRKRANEKVSELVRQKKYSKALAYFASSIIGRRAQNTQWIDITCIQLEELPQNENDLRVRRLLEAVPQELDRLLSNAWLQIFDINQDKAPEIKELLRVLVLTFEDPTEAEIGLLVGLSATKEDRVELQDLVTKCRPLLRFTQQSNSDKKICFIEEVVRTHLLENAHMLLGLSEEDTKLQHGILSLRAFSHVMEAFTFPMSEELDGDEGQDENNNPICDDDVDEEVGSVSDGGSEGSESEENEAEDALSDDSDEDDTDDEVDEDTEADELKDLALAYAVKYWLDHASKATVDIAEVISEETEFWETNSIIRRRWLTEHTRLTGAFEGYERFDLCGMHVTAALGFRQLVLALMRNGHEDEKDLMNSSYFAPLHYAAAFGKVEVVEGLLSREAQIDQGIEGGSMTPLHSAAAEGNVKVMKMLLKKGANPNAICGVYGGVINAAIESGNCDAVKLLVEYNVRLARPDDAENEPDETGQSVDEDKETHSSDEHEERQLADQNEVETSGNDEDAEEEEDEDEEEDGDDEAEEEEEQEEEVIQSPLALAASRSDITMFNFLLDNYSDKLPTEEFDAALVKAAETGRMEAFKRLLVSFTHSAETLQDALNSSATENNWDIVTLLLETCPDLDCDEAFLCVAKANDEPHEIQILEAMWEYAHESISTATLDESLYNATDYENSKTVQTLLRFGASADATGEEYGNALTAAAFDGTTHIVEMLLDAGANIDSADGWALQTAAFEGHTELVRLLLDRGANVNACTNNEQMPQGTALQAAVEASNLETVNLLLEHNADPNLGNGEFTCPIIAAARKGEAKILERLIQAKADVDVFGGPDMSTPLINVAACLPVSSIRSVLDAGADINLPDVDGDTALIVAAGEGGDPDCVKFLLDRGANVLLKNKRGKNALEAALEIPSNDSVAVLVEHVSKIMEALRVAMDSGDAAVTAVVRSVECHNQGLDYGDPVGKESKPDAAPQPDVQSDHQLDESDADKGKSVVVQSTKPEQELVDNIEGHIDGGSPKPQQTSDNFSPEAKSPPVYIPFDPSAMHSGPGGQREESQTLSPHATPIRRKPAPTLPFRPLSFQERNLNNAQQSQLHYPVGQTQPPAPASQYQPYRPPQDPAFEGSRHESERPGPTNFRSSFLGRGTTWLKDRTRSLSDN